jgi:hypothetical protein
MVLERIDSSICCLQYDTYTRHAALQINVDAKYCTIPDTITSALAADALKLGVSEKHFKSAVTLIKNCELMGY